MAKIVKNITSPLTPIFITDIGRNLPDLNYTIPEQDYLLWAQSDDAQTEIDNDNLLLNDSVITLTKANSKTYIKYPDQALNLRFLGNTPRGNAFPDGLTVQQAIEATAMGGVSSSEGTNNIFSSSGTTIISSSFIVMAFGVVSLSTVTAKFISVVKATGVEVEVVVRLFDVDDAVELASLTFEVDNDPVRQEVTFTLPGGNHMVELQAKRSVGTGTLYMGEIR